MRPRVPPRWFVLAFLYAAVVPFGLLFGPISLVRFLGSSLPGGEVVFMFAWALVLLAGTTVLSARVPVHFTHLLPAMVAGVVVAFGGVQIVVWRTQSVIAMVFGLIALLLVVAGSWLGTQLSGVNADDDRAGREIVRTARVVAVMALATALVSGTVYWLQDTPRVYSVASGILFSASPVVGFVAVWRGRLRLWIFLPLLAALPFVVMIADMATDPIALAAGLPPGGLLSFNAATIDLSTSVTALVGAGSVLAGGLRYLHSKEWISTVIGTDDAG